MQTIKTILTILAITASAYGGYNHGFYVGKLDGQANTSALQEAGYIPTNIDSSEVSWIR